MEVVITWGNAGPHTIWATLARQLGREPTPAEAKAEVLRILDEGMVNRAAKGQLRHQRKRRGAWSGNTKHLTSKCRRGITQVSGGRTPGEVRDGQR